ncbi:MAG: alpha/beta hydrolase [Chloroflexi bacterium]|nr:alpha/beta hydrolase [Chloroflexota bacterium]
MTPPAIYRSVAGEQAVQARYDALLARWPVPYQALHIPTRYGETFVIDSGSQAAQPLVLLHGAGTNSAMWAGDVAEYSRHYRVLAIDLLGEAGKSAPNRMDWAGPAYAEWLDEVLQSLGIKAVTLIGLSQGAWTALKFAIYTPASVTALVALSPAGIVPDKLSFVSRALPLSLLGGWGIRRINRLVLGGQSVPAEIEETMTLNMTHFKTRVGVVPLFSDDELRRLRMPVQLVIGRRDALRDAEKIAARMQQLVPQLTPTIIPDAGHALINSRAYILPFLAATASGAPV